MTAFEKKIKEFLSEISEKSKNPNGYAFWESLVAAEKLLQKMPSKKSGKVEKGVVIKGKVFLSKGAIIKSGVRIEGNLFVGENSVIGPNSFLRGFVILQKNCFIGTSEVKNSVFLEDSRAPHFNYIGDSILCEHVNLGAGTKIANLRHDNEHIFVQMNGQKVDSMQRKLGALIGANTKTGINSSINCGTIVPAGTKILPNQFYKK